MRKSILSVLVVLLVAVMVVTACGAKAGVGIKVGQVTDTGGIDDRSFNATAWKGVQDAVTNLGIEGKYLESQQQTDYERNIKEFLDQKYDLIVTVGYLLGDATKAAAEANPDRKFAIVDSSYTPEIPNVLGLTFATDEAAFLAGYLAAGMSKTGKVGTFGGIAIPPVTIFMVGFEKGVMYYNQQKGTNVQVLGWKTDPSAEGCGTGLFTGNFESTDDGRRFGTQLMDEGADIVVPVAGPVGVGTASAVQERGMMMIGVDTDWYVSAEAYKAIYLSSILKNMDVAVYDAIKAVVDKTFKGGTYLGTLKNNGVGLAGFHDFDSKVPAALKAEIDQLKKDIIAGKVATGWADCFK